MVNMKNVFTRAALLLASLASVANADLQITAPSADIWWVAKSTNVLTWTCSDTSIQSFTVLISNTNPNVLVSPLAIIAIQQNSQCSITVSQDQSNQPAGTGYIISFGNIVNNTDVYATSQPFEIKPLGSLYPSQVTASANASSASSTGSNSAAGSKPTSAASTTVAKGMAASVFGLALGAVGMML